MDEVDKTLLKFHLGHDLAGLDEDGLKRFCSALVSEPKTNKRKAHCRAQKTPTQLRSDAIVKETAQIAANGNVLPGYYNSVSGECKPVPQLSVTIPGPPLAYAWTRDLGGYEAARMSAVNALHREWASGQAAAAGHSSKTPEIDEFLFLIRAGRIKKGDPVIEEAINVADKRGYSGNIRERIVQELHNAEKRVPKDFCDFNVSKSFFYDLNWFHMTLAALWVRCLFWLMPDALIVDFLLRKKAGPPTTRQAVSQAVLQMGLVKHEPLLVKSIGRGFELVFVEGYPPTR
jgi:hypothetical protein